MTRRSNNSFFPPNLSNGVIPDISTESDLSKYRKIAFFLSNQGSTRDVADYVLGSLASVRDEESNLIFTDMRKTAPHVVLAEQIAHIGSMVNFMTSNIPLLIEDHIINMQGQPPLQGIPEFVWISYRLTEPLGFDYTISAGRSVTTESGDKKYTSVYSLTIPAGAIGLESGEDGRYLYAQLYRSELVGTSQRVAPRELTKPFGAISYVEDVINWESSFGGRDRELYSDYRIRAFQEPSDNLTITPNDYVRRIENFIGPSTKSIVISSYGYSKDVNIVDISVILPNGDILTPDMPIATALKNYLDDRDPNGTVRVISPAVTEITVKLNIVSEALGDYDIPAMRGAVKLAVDQFSNPLNWEDWGEQENNFTAGKLLDYIRSRIPDIDSASILQISALNRDVDVNQDYKVALDNFIGIPKIILSEDDIIITREALL